MSVKIAKIDKIENITATPANGGVLDENTTYYGVVFAVEDIGYGVNCGAALSPISDEFTFTTDTTDLSADVDWDVPASPNCQPIHYVIVLTKTSGYYYGKPTWGNPRGFGTIDTNSYNVGGVAKNDDIDSGVNIPFVIKDRDGADYKLPFSFQDIADEGLIRVFSQGNFTLQDVKDQAVADGVGDHVYYDGHSLFGIFGSFGWESGDANSTSTTLDVTNHTILFVQSSGIHCRDGNVTLNFGDSTGANGCNISNISYSTVYDFYYIRDGSINFYGCRIDTHQYASFKNGSAFNFFKSLLYFERGCYVLLPLIDVTIVTGGGYDLPYSTDYRKKVTLVNTYALHRATMYNKEYINCGFFNDLSYDINPYGNYDEYPCQLIDCSFYSADEVMRPGNKPNLNPGILFDVDLYKTIKITTEPFASMIVTDKNDNLASLYDIEATGEIGSLANNPVTADGNGVIEYYILTNKAVETSWIDYSPFTFIISKSGYKTYEIEFTISEKTDWTIKLEPHRFRETRSR